MPVKSEIPAGAKSNIIEAPCSFQLHAERSSRKYPNKHQSIMEDEAVEKGTNSVLGDIRGVVSLVKTLSDLLSSASDLYRDLKKHKYKNPASGQDKGEKHKHRKWLLGKRDTSSSSSNSSSSSSSSSNSESASEYESASESECGSDFESEFESEFGSEFEFESDSEIIDRHRKTETRESGIKRRMSAMKAVTESR